MPIRVYPSQHSQQEWYDDELYNAYRQKVSTVRQKKKYWLLCKIAGVVIVILWLLYLKNAWILCPLPTTGPDCARAARECPAPGGRGDWSATASGGGPTADGGGRSPNQGAV